MATRMYYCGESERGFYGRVKFYSSKYEDSPPYRITNEELEIAAKAILDEASRQNRERYGTRISINVPIKGARMTSYERRREEEGGIQIIRVKVYE